MIKIYSRYIKIEEINNQNSWFWNMDPMDPSDGRSLYFVKCNKTNTYKRKGLLVPENRWIMSWSFPRFQSELKGLEDQFNFSYLFNWIP